jgi:hypothetical protein
MPFDNGSYAPLLAGRYETSKKLGANGLALGQSPGIRGGNLGDYILRPFCEDYATTASYHRTSTPMTTSLKSAFYTVAGKHEIAGPKPQARAASSVFVGMESLVCLVSGSLTIDGKLHYAWLQTVERKWGTSRYSGTIKWRYRLPSRSRSH